ncbi:START domain-containing protein 10 [Porites harrisoni]
MQVGEVRAARAEDFEHFRRLAESVDGWNLQYDKQGTKVFSKVKDGSTVRLIKLQVNAPSTGKTWERG